MEPCPICKLAHRPCSVSCRFRHMPSNSIYFDPNGSLLPVDEVFDNIVNELGMNWDQYVDESDLTTLPSVNTQPLPAGELPCHICLFEDLQCFQDCAFHVRPGSPIFYRPDGTPQPLLSILVNILDKLEDRRGEEYVLRSDNTIVQVVRSVLTRNDLPADDDAGSSSSNSSTTTDHPMSAEDAAVVYLLLMFSSIILKSAA